MSCTLVRLKIASCVSVLSGLQSTYRWKGKLAHSKECLLMIKAPKKNFGRIRRCIENSHPYELPEIIAVPITAGSRRYLKWIEQSVRV